MKLLSTILLTLSSIAITSAQVSILDYGAIPNDQTNAACHANSKAIEIALYHADSIPASNEVSDRTVIVPSSQSFCIFETVLNNITDVVFQVDGELLVSDNTTEWRSHDHSFVAVLNFYFAKNVVITGDGGMTGQGYKWWWNAILKPSDSSRPHLLWMESGENLRVEGLFFNNSPNFHVRIYDVKGLVIRGITIHVDVVAQNKLHQDNGNWKWLDEGLLSGIPTFPLNTDGIDISGNDILIEDCNIQNYDDAIVVKPNDINSYWDTCSSDVLVRNINVTLGVGMSIGSMGPKLTHPCVKNVTFDNIKFDAPLKAIYIKSNPGDEGDGIISDITFSNIVMKNALWIPIWIGPQQMHEPGEEGTGCSFLYPLGNAKCPSQPLITISDIKLINITMENNLLLPGVILGDEANPFSGIVMENVVAVGGKNLISEDYICENAEGEQTGNSPKASCF